MNISSGARNKHAPDITRSVTVRSMRRATEYSCLQSILISHSWILVSSNSMRSIASAVFSARSLHVSFSSSQRSGEPRCSPCWGAAWPHPCEKTTASHFASLPSWTGSTGFGIAGLLQLPRAAAFGFAKCSGRDDGLSHCMGRLLAVKMGQVCSKLCSPTAHSRQDGSRMNQRSL